MSNKDHYRLAIIVPVRQRGLDLRSELEAYYLELESCDMLVIVDDGSKDGSCDVIAAFAENKIRVRIVRFRNPAYYHGGWKIVYSELSADYVYFVHPHYAVLPGMVRSLMRAATDSHAAVVFGNVLEHDRADRIVKTVAVPGWNDSKTEEPSAFLTDFLREAPPLYPQAHAAVYRLDALKACGLFQEELDSFSPLFTFIVAGLSGGVRFEPCSVVLRKDCAYFTYTRYTTNSLRQIDFACRAAHLMKQEPYTSLIPGDVVDDWRTRTVHELVNREVSYISSGILSAKKAVEAIARESSFPARVFLGLVQFMIGAGRRTLFVWTRFRMSRYRPDLSCYVPLKRRFSFGKNWHRFIRENFTEERLEIARKDLLWFLDMPNLEGKRFLDIGCGSGLMSLSAMRAGASFVEAFDYDIYSVKASNRLRQKEGNPVNWTICQGSILDPEFIKTLKPADVVYSWGVLHHTGKMWEAIKNTSTLINPGGLMYIAIYTKWQGSDDAMRLKVRYNQASWLGKKVIQYRFVRSYFPAWSDLFTRPGYFCERLKERYTFIVGYKRLRGMHYMADIRDWLGGYPYEDASVEELIWFCETMCNLKLVRLDPRGGNRCSLYLFKRAAAD